ncbi:MAG: LysM domain-containing protein, partial [Pseudohongiellaceae bacterium]
FARSVGISLEQLRADNPALRPPVWEGAKRIPRGFRIKVRSDAVPGSNLLAMIPSDFKFTVQTPDVEYIVERGDSLSVIARRFNTTVGDLASLNQLASRNRLQIGQRLLLPQDNLDTEQLATIANIEEDGVYTVRRGDTVSLIATRYDVPEQQLLGVNGIADRHLIYPGQELRVPGFGPDGEEPSTTASAVDVAPERTAVTAAAPAAGEVEEEVIITPVEAAQAPADGAAVRAPDADPQQLALVEEQLPPAAVLPDDQQLDAPVTEAESDAVALDPAIDVAASNEQVSELLTADPSDYSVASNNTIEIQASETLGHYAEWLGIRAWDLRRLNNMAFRDPVIIGDRLRLDLSRVNIDEFELKRRDFHSSLQEAFFSSFRIQGVEKYQIRRGDNIGSIARSRYSTPIWLLRQYNPELDFSRIQIGQEIDFPLLEVVR